MAIGEIGTFLPAESAYGTPGAYSQALRAEATKRARYLSDMDQFYTSLEESKRQFEETMTFREESWEDQMTLRKSELALQKRLGIGQLLLGMFQAKKATTGRTRTGHIDLGRDERLDFLKQMWRDQQRKESGGSGYEPSFSYPSTGYPGMFD